MGRLVRHPRLRCENSALGAREAAAVSPTSPALYSLSIEIIRVCWLTFAVVWLLAAFVNKRSIYKENRWQRLRYSILLVVGYLLLANGNRLGHPLAFRVIPRSNVIALGSALLCIAGLLFCLWARATLGRNWSGTITLKEGHELIVRGPYRIVRHPIYTGLLAMFIATVAATGHVAAILGAVLAFISIWIKLNQEEALMLQQFPGDYAAYRQKTKRLIPFVL